MIHLWKVEYKHIGKIDSEGEKELKFLESFITQDFLFEPRGKGFIYHVSRVHLEDEIEDFADDYGEDELPWELIEMLRAVVGREGIYGREIDIYLE